MKKVMYSIVVVNAIILTSCGENKTEEHNHSGHDHSEMSSTKYACPMKCEGEKTYNKKGECPKLSHGFKRGGLKFQIAVSPV